MGNYLWLLMIPYLCRWLFVIIWHIIDVFNEKKCFLWLFVIIYLCILLKIFLLSLVVWISEVYLKKISSCEVISSCEMMALKVNKIVHHDTNLVLGRFKDYSSLAGKLLKKLLNPQISLLWILSFSITKELFKLILLILPLSLMFSETIF